MATDLLTADANAARGPASSMEETLAEPTDAGGLRATIDRAGQGTSVKKSLEGHAARGISAALNDWVQLTKPRIVVMILVTTTATAMIGAGGWVPAAELSWLLLATAAVAGSAGAANQVWERAIDQRMTRTSSRPLPTGRLGTTPAIVFTFVLGVVGTALLHWMFGPVPALAGLVTWLLYVLVYTPMKTRTAWNTTVGAIAGALPVLIGYTALGGSLLDATPWLLVAVLVAWQYPHFMSIAWMYRRQYAEAGFCMTTTVEPTGRSAGWQSIAGSLVLIGCGIALCLIPEGWIGGVVSACAIFAAAGPMLFASIGFTLQPDDRLARKLLRCSLLVLPAVLAIVTLRVFW